MKGVHNLWGQVAIIVVSLAVGLIFPFAFLVAAFMAFTIYSDVKGALSGVEPAQDPVVVSFYDRESDYTWEELSEYRTESPAELAFLKAMIKEFNLKPAGDDLAGNGLRFAFQREILRYRVDFSLNDWLIVEIDGAEWHTSPDAVERDGIRDAALRELDYSILRIPAKTVVKTPATAIWQVKAALEKPTKPITEIERDRRAKAAKPKVKPAGRVLGGIKAIGTALDDLDKFTEQARERQRIEDALAKPKQTFEIEKSLIDTAIRSSKLEIEVDGMGAEFKESYLRNKRVLEDKCPPPDLNAAFGKYGLIFSSSPKAGNANFDAAVAVRFLELKEERRKYLDGIAASLEGRELQKLTLRKLNKMAGLQLAGELGERVNMLVFDYML